MNPNVTRKSIAVLVAACLINILNFMPGPYHWHDLLFGIMSAQYALWLVIGVATCCATWFLIYRTDFYPWADDTQVERLLSDDNQVGQEQT